MLRQMVMGALPGMPSARPAAQAIAPLVSASRLRHIASRHETCPVRNPNGALRGIVGSHMNHSSDVDCDERERALLAAMPGANSVELRQLVMLAEERGHVTQAQ